MIDREKVVEALHCRAYDDDLPCSICAYYRPGEKPVAKCDYRGLMDDAIALLKEQEAVKPYIDIDEAKCPICKVKLTRQELLGDDVLFEDFFDYCPHCGRRVKWDE